MNPFKRFLATCLVMAMGLPCIDNQNVLAEYRTPETTIRTYWLRMLERHHLDALDCFVEGRPRDLTGMLALPDLVELRTRDFTVRDLGRGRADVRYKVEFRVTLQDSLRRFETGDRVHRTRAGWKIARPMLVASDPR